MHTKLLRHTWLKRNVIADLLLGDLQFKVGLSRVDDMSALIILLSEEGALHHVLMYLPDGSRKGRNKC